MLPSSASARAYVPARSEEKGMEYSVQVWRTPIREWKEVLFRLTYRREWIPELNCWRDVVVRQERI
jgi:hypothetical protein